MSRSVPEWIGKTDDTRPPPRVLDRIFTRDDGICHICSGKIAGKKWEADHIIALINGGENRESNLAPAHVQCHKGKTAKDKAKKSKIARQRGKHNGSIRPKSKLQSRGFVPTGKRPKINKAAVDAAAVKQSGGIARQFGE